MLFVVVTLLYVIILLLFVSTVQHGAQNYIQQVVVAYLYQIYVFICYLTVYLCVTIIHYAK